MKRSRLDDDSERPADAALDDKSGPPSPATTPSEKASTAADTLRTFPYRLHSLLSDSQYENAIKWSSDGKSFGYVQLGRAW